MHDAESHCPRHDDTTIELFDIADPTPGSVTVRLKVPVEFAVLTVTVIDEELLKVVFVIVTTAPEIETVALLVNALPVIVTVNPV